LIHSKLSLSNWKETLEKDFGMLGHLLKGRKTSIKAAEQKALLGRIECDSPKALVEYIMTLFN